MIKKCKFCGREFTRRTNNHKYCSLDCRDAWRGKHRATKGRNNDIQMAYTPRVTMDEVLQFAEEHCRRTGHYPRYGEAVRLMEEKK